MTRASQSIHFLLSGKLWLGILKAGILLFVVLMILIQIPELRYDALADRAVIINSVDDLVPGLLAGTSYGRITGTPTFDYSFSYERYGLRFTYFTLEEYGVKLVARGYDLVEFESGGPIVLEGKLRPFESQPFAYAVRDLFLEQNGVLPPEDAFFFGIGDVPGPNGWQLGSIIFAAILFGIMFYFFYLFRRGKRGNLFANPLHGLVPDEKDQDSVQD